MCMARWFVVVPLSRRFAREGFARPQSPATSQNNNKGELRMLDDYFTKLHKLERKHGRHFPDLAQAEQFDRCNAPICSDCQQPDDKNGCACVQPYHRYIVGG